MILCVNIFTIIVRVSIFVSFQLNLIPANILPLTLCPNVACFLIVTAPPKKILSESSTLVEENLIGYAVIYFGSSSSESPILRDSVQVSDPEKVFHFTPNPGHLLPRSHKVPTTTAPASHVNEAGTSRGSASSGAPKNSAAASRAVNSNVVPKWFKK